MKIHPNLETLTATLSREDLLLILNRLYAQHFSGVLGTIKQYCVERIASQTISNLVESSHESKDS